MPLVQSIELSPLHKPLWAQFQQIQAKNRLGHALLFVGSQHSDMLQFITHLTASLLCQDVVSPCGHCSACVLTSQGSHPDIHSLRQDKPGSAIKIDQIRQIQQAIYQTPKRGLQRVVIIERAEKMNTAAANALLKALEEPPSHTFFILTAEQFCSLLPTIVSRCQKWLFPTSLPDKAGNYLMAGQFYGEGTGRAMLFKQKETLIETFLEFIDQKLTQCTLVSQWSIYPWEDILWFLYLLTAQLIYYQQVEEGSGPMAQLAHRLSSLILFKQLDHINELQRKINHNVTINLTLALENLLTGYLRIKNG